MKYGDNWSHRGAKDLMDSMKLSAEVLGALSAPDVVVARGTSGVIKEHIADYLRRQGWASPVQVEPTLDMQLNAIKGSALLHVQTGNIARAFYDLMKMQSVFDQRRADVAVLIVPSREAARTIGGNLAQFERVQKELDGAFCHQVSVPVWLLAFE